MDSIAERIGLCSHCLTDETRFCHTDCFHYERYKEAVKQRNIDIEKACEIYEKELRQMKRILNEVKDGAGELISVGGSLIQFRKAMEE